MLIVTQHTLSRSSAEAEYRGVANVVAEMAWLRNLLRELYTQLLTVTLVHCYNVSVVYLSANSVQHQRTKHIKIDIHFVRDMVAMGHVRVLHVLSRYQYADTSPKAFLWRYLKNFDEEDKEEEEHLAPADPSDESTNDLVPSS
nr:ribonuclease H-like domain-containing protein [Tanacetum cinerariifolium]